MDCARGVVFLRAFFCLKQDGQDVQDEQDERQVREDLNVYRHQQVYGEKVREDLNVQRLGVHARDRPSHYGGRGAFFCSAGDRPPQSLPHPVHPVHLGHPASDVIDIKVLTDLFCLLRLNL